MTQRRRSYFFSSVIGSLGKLFKTGNKPDEKAFFDLMDSILFKTESSDTMTSSTAGHAMLATNSEVASRIVSRSSNTVLPTAAQLPGVSLDDSGTEISDTSLNGLQLLVVKKSGGYICYVPKLLVDSGIFKFDNNNLTIKEGSITNIMLGTGIVDIENIEVLDKGSVITGDGATKNYKVKLEQDGQIFVYNNSEGGLWKCLMNGDATMSKTGVITIANQVITLAKMKSLDQGRIIVGPKRGGTPVALDASSEGYILVGQGDELKSVALSGVISITKSGAVSFVDASIKTRHLDSSKLGVGLTTSDIGDNMKLDVNIGSGLYLDGDGKICSNVPLKYTVYGETTDDTKTELFTDGMTGRITVDEDYAYFFEILCIGVQTGGTVGTAGDTWMKKVVGSIANKGATTAILGTNVDIYDDGDIALTVVVDVEADDTNDSLKISVTGEVDKTISWTVDVNITKKAL
jgi:hypothetical protein